MLDFDRKYLQDQNLNIFFEMWRCITAVIYFIYNFISVHVFISYSIIKSQLILYAQLHNLEINMTSHIHKAFNST